MQAVVPVKKLSTAPADLETVFRANQAQMLQAAHRITGDAQDAEDVLQTVFLKLVRREAPIGLVSDETSYLRRAAVNSALDLVRSRRKGNVVPFDQVGGSPASAGKALRDAPFIEDDLRGWLRAKLAEMSPMAAEAFVLRYFEELTNREIADVLGTSQNSVAVLLHRTRKRLQQELREETGDADV